MRTLSCFTVVVIAALGSARPLAAGDAIRSGPITAAERAFWSFRPVVRPRVPTASLRARSPIDAFVERALGDLPATGDANRGALLRRATFDLIGLPPSQDEVRDFLADTSADAFERVVDRLLASPHLGERWGRHWLDVVRYADTAGETADYPVPLAWKYRNWVIDAFNRDMPYDAFVRAQIAGDLLAATAPRERFEGLVTATGFLAVSRRFGFGIEEFHHLTLQDAIDTTGQAVLGLTLGCARCHDHKYDPVTMADYYGWYGILDGATFALSGDEKTRKERRLVPALPVDEAAMRKRAYEAKLAALDAEVKALRDERVPIDERLRALAGSDHGFEAQRLDHRPGEPWSSHPNARIVASAQSPFINVYPAGSRGIAFPSTADNNHFGQRIQPPRTASSTGELAFNIDFRNVSRAGNGTGAYRFYLGRGPGHSAAVELGASATTLWIKDGGAYKRLRELELGRWYSLRLVLDLGTKTYSGSVGSPGDETHFADVAFTSGWDGTIDQFFVDDYGPSGGVSPARELDNFAVRERPFPPAETSFEDDVATTSEERWRSFIDSGRLAAAVRDTDGHADFHVWRTPPLPIVGVNVSKTETRTVPGTVPPRSLVVHPQERDGVAIAWRSPLDGGVRLSGTVADAHDCGDSVLWFVDRLDGDGLTPLASGDTPRAGQQTLADGATSSRLLDVAVRRGDFLQLGILPKAHYGCDLTRIEFTIEELDGDRRWSVVDDVIDDFHAGNPHADRLGHPGTWHFYRLPPDRGAAFATESEIATAPATIATLRRRLGELDTRLGEIMPARDAHQSAGPYPLVYGVVEGPEPADTLIHLRGNPTTPGERTPRRDLEILGGAKLASPATSSGRLDLASWLTRPDNPLTARVMANRLWLHHIGRGIVETPNDFGVRGAPPSHPDLLDWLASELVSSGWSLKHVHRLIAVSSVYRRSSAPPAGRLSPAQEVERTRRFGRFERRRLDAEAIRDAMLAVSGRLDRSTGEGHPFPPSSGWGFTQHAPFYAVYPTRRRSVYLMTQRLKRHPFLGLFDGADTNSSVGRRGETTTPTQALYLLNSDFVHEQAAGLATRILAHSVAAPARVRFAFETALGRPPRASEVAASVDFISRYATRLDGVSEPRRELEAWSAFARSLLIRNEFLHVE